MRQSIIGPPPKFHGARDILDSEPYVVKYRPPMGFEQDHVHFEGGRELTLNWGFIVAVVLCVEFWVAPMAAALAL